MEHDRERKRHSARMLLRPVQHTGCRRAESDRCRARSGSTPGRFAPARSPSATCASFVAATATSSGRRPRRPAVSPCSPAFRTRPFQLKLEGMLAKAFQLHGLEPVAAVPADPALPMRYFELFGVRRFVAARGLPDARARGRGASRGRGAARRGARAGRPAAADVSRRRRRASGAVDGLPLPARRRRRPCGRGGPRTCCGRLLPSAVRSTLAFEAAARRRGAASSSSSTSATTPTRARSATSRSVAG